MTSETTIEDRIAARIARIANARDQVVRTLVADLKASIRGAEAGGQVANPLERRAVEVLERLIAPETVTLHKPAAMGKTTDLGATCVVVDDDPAFEDDGKIEAVTTAPKGLWEFALDASDHDGIDVKGKGRREIAEAVLGSEFFLSLIKASIVRLAPSIADQLPDDLSQFLTPEIVVNSDLHAVLVRARNWNRPKRTRRPTRAEKIAASKSGA